MRRIAYTVLVIIIALLLMSFIMVAFFQLDSRKSNCEPIIGTIKTIREGGAKDMVFELENQQVSYYINRAFENGFELNKAKNDFEGKSIKLFYAKGWTPLAPFGTTCKHAAYIAINDSVIYSEWE